MNDELVERLRTRGGRPDGFGLGRICDQAADRIEALTAQLAEARKSERAAIVAWLRNRDEPGAEYLATWIEAGDHLT